MRNQMMKKTLSCALVAVATIGVTVSLMRAEKIRAERQSNAGPRVRKPNMPR